MRTTASILAVALLSTGAVFAADTAAPAAKPAAAPAPAKASTMTAAAPAAAKPAHTLAMASGEVTAIDAAKKTLTLKEASGDATFAWTTATHVTMADGKAGHQADIKVGDHVKIGYSKHGASMVAKSVKISK